MKKIISVLLAAFMLSAPAASLEWGGVFKNDTSLYAADFSSIKDTSTFVQSDGVYLWLNTPLTSDASTYLTGEVMYKFKMNMAGFTSPVFSNIVDLDLLKFVSDFSLGNTKVSINAGRFRFSDASSAVINQVLDGASIAFKFPAMSVSLVAGYTGLLNTLNVYMLDGTGTAISANNTIYSLGANYLPLGGSVEFNTLGGNQSLLLQALAVLDVSGGNTNRLYADVKLSGPITNSFYYSLTSVFGTSTFTSLMNFTDLQFYSFIGKVASLALGCEYASGTYGIFTDYVGFTSRTAYNSINYPETRGILMPKFTAGLTDGRFYSGFTAKYVLDFSTAQLAAKGLDINVSILYNIFTDLQIGLNLMGYIDMAGTSESNYGASVSLAFAF